ncbi:MAG: AAA family ATPase, partial [Gemmatimonadota bacterium]|nr:AAA family ATPase [Gemmatimonadota bacterium]
VDFRNTVVIMTSNVGSQWILEHAGGSWEETERFVHDALRQTFKPEFLNRVDDTVVFRPLAKEDLSAIIELRLSDLGRMLEEREIGLEVSEGAKSALIAEGYDVTFGARPLKRVIQRRIQDPLAMALLEGEFVAGDKVSVKCDSNGVYKFDKVSEFLASA